MHGGGEVIAGRFGFTARPDVQVFRYRIGHAGTERGVFMQGPWVRRGTPP
jgi:hypothetical protein